MSHPQPPFGSYDPNQQPAEPTQPFPTAPMPSAPGNPYAPQPTDPYAPPPADPYAPPPTQPFASQPPSDPFAPQPSDPYAPQPTQPFASQPPTDPYAPQPPTSGVPYPPPGAPAYPPISGAPQAGYPPQPPTSGAPYPPPGQFPPPPSGPYPPAPGQPFAPPPAKKSGKKVWLIIGLIAAILLVLCCGGGIYALYSGAKKTQEAIESIPTPGISYGSDTPTAGPQNTAEPRQTDGETFNMKPGDTLILTDDDGTVEITVSNFRTKNKSCQQYMPGPKNGVYMIADVTAEVTKGTGSINPFFFRWIAADGTQESGVGGAFSGCGKLMGSGNSLPTGSKRSGQLVFDVKDTNGTLEYEHNLRTAGSWKP